MNKYMKLTEEERVIIRENFNKITLRQIISLMPRWTNFYTRFKKHTRKMGLIRDRNKTRLPIKCSYNRHYWKDLTLNNCYLAGHLAADGCIKEHKVGHYSFSLDISLDDESIIDNYYKELEFDGKRYYHENLVPSGLRKTKFVSMTIFCFNENAEYLRQHFNLQPNKTKRLRPPNLENKYYKFSYLIGLIDGDGSIGASGSQRGKYKKSPFLSYSSSSKDIVDWIKEMIDTYSCPSSRKQVSTVLKIKNSNCYSYSVCGLRAAVIINYLRQFPVPKLARKWENPEVLAYIEEKKKLRPELFIEPDQTELAALMPKPLPVEVPQNPVLAV